MLAEASLPADLTRDGRSDSTIVCSNIGHIFVVF